MTTKKTFQQFQENIAIDAVKQGLGVKDDILPPIVIRNLKQFAKQKSNALQPSIEQLLSDIERELNKYGMTLGTLDSYEFEDKDSEDFIILAFPSSTEIKNTFLTLSWEKVSPDATEYRSEVLNFRVKLQVNLIDPNDYDSLVSDAENVEIEDDDYATGDDVFGDDDYDLMAEEVKSKKTSDMSSFKNKLKSVDNSKLKQKLKKYRDSHPQKYELVVNEFEQRGLKEGAEYFNESHVVYKHLGKTLFISEDSTDMQFVVNPDGSIVLAARDLRENVTTHLQLNKTQSKQFMTKLMDHFLQYTQ